MPVIYKQDRESNMNFNCPLNRMLFYKDKSNIDSGGGSKIVLDVPAQDTNLFKSQAVHEVLSFLSRYHTDVFSITELTDAVDYSGY